MSEYIMPNEQYIKLQKFIERLSEIDYLGDIKINEIPTNDMVQNLLKKVKGEK